MIQSVKLIDGGYKVTLDDESILFVPDDGTNRHYQRWRPLLIPISMIMN